MTDTELKLPDTQIQLELTEANTANAEVFRSCINAAVALGRSVTFVMQAESAESKGLTRWYREQIRGRPEQSLLKYFNYQRVFTIHKGTIAPSKAWFAVLGPQRSESGAAIFAEQSAEVWVLDGTEAYGLGRSLPALPLCQRYVAILQNLASDWLAKRSAA